MTTHLFSQNRYSITPEIFQAMLAQLRPVGYYPKETEEVVALVCTKTPKGWIKVRVESKEKKSE